MPKSSRPETPSIDKPRYRSTFYYEGKRYEDTSSISQKAADQKAAVRREKLKRGETGISSSMPVRRWAEEWLETYKRPAIGEGQYRNYLAHINGVINPTIGSMSLKSVKAVHLQKILNSRAGKSKSDVTKLRILIQAMFKRAYQSKLITNNPAEFLELPAAMEGKRRSLTETERKCVLGFVEKHHAGLWIKTLLYTGMRPGETRALDWRHVDLDKRIIHVVQSVKAGTNVIGEPKSAAGIRDIPIPDALYTALNAAKSNPFDPVFTQPTTGKRHTHTSMKCLWNNFKRELDIYSGAKVFQNAIKISTLAPDLVPYCFSHTYCTDLQDAGVPINIAKYLMGHADISMTAKIYTHTTDKAIQEAAEKINHNASGGNISGKPKENH